MGKWRRGYTVYDIDTTSAWKRTPVPRPCQFTLRKTERITTGWEVGWAPELI
jgi:hypothetical protein